MATTDDGALAGELRRIGERRLSKASRYKSIRRRLFLMAAALAFTQPAYGLVNRLEVRGLLGCVTSYYDESIVDMPADHLVQMTRVEAEVGCAQVRRYHSIVAHRRRIAAIYDEALQGLPWLRVPPMVEGATYSHYVPRVDDKQGLLEFARSRGIQLGWLIEYSIPEMRAYRDRPGARHPYPVASRLAATTVNLPLWVEESVATRVAGVLREWNGP